MEVNPTDQTCRNPIKPINRARFRGGPQMREEKSMNNGECKNCSEMPCRCSSGVSKKTPTSSQTQTQRSDLFQVCLNCPSDNGWPCVTCSAVSAASQNHQSTIMTCGSNSAVATEAPEEDEGSVYNGRRGGFTEFQKPSTTTAMIMPGAEEATMYNGKIFSSLFSDHHQSVTNRSGCLISFGKLPSNHSASVHTEEGTSSGRLGRSKRRWQGADLMEEEEEANLALEREEEAIHKEMRFGSASFASTSTMQSGVESGTTDQLPEPAGSFSSSNRKRRKIETIRVPAVNSRKSQVPQDGYIWWKCGEKQMKGSPYPKSYYKCKTQTWSDCLAKKQVIRALDEPSMLDVTYIDDHCHEPLFNAAAAASSILTPTSATAFTFTDIAPDAIPAATVEEPTTIDQRQFLEFL